MKLSMKPKTEGKAWIDAAQLSLTNPGAYDILHELKNCLSVMLLNIDNIKADSGHTAREALTLENTIHKMTCLLEELAKVLGEQCPQKTMDASRTNVILRAISLFGGRSLTRVN